MTKTTAPRSSIARPAKGQSTNRPRQVIWWTQGGGLYAHEVLKGVLDYVREHPAWTLHPMWDPPEREWRAWKGDGILLCCDFKSKINLGRLLQIPMVDLSASRFFPTLPWVESDNAAMGRLAAEHLLERGLKHFGFCGISGKNYSDWRRDGFVQRLRAAGFPCAVFCPSGKREIAPAEAIAKWLKSLPKPIGILGDPSARAREILAACQRLGLAVPEEIAIITSKANAEFDLLEKPVLSSVNVNTSRIGYEAAVLLERLMSGAMESPGTAHLIAPLGVESRQSTDMLAIPDPQIAASLRYIWQHACEGIQIKNVLRAVPQSRQQFEQRFQRYVGRTPHDEIIRLRMNRAKELLAGTNLPLKNIAECTGFIRAAYLATAFQKLAGMTPGKYRLIHGSIGGQ